MVAELIVFFFFKYMNDLSSNRFFKLNAGATTKYEAESILYSVYERLKVSYLLGTFKIFMIIYLS